MNFWKHKKKIQRSSKSVDLSKAIELSKNNWILTVETMQLKKLLQKISDLLKLKHHLKRN